MFTILKWMGSVAAVLIAAYFLPGVVVAGIWSALIVALVLGLLNLTIKPLLVLLTLPINIITLGLFTFVINAIMVLLTSSIVRGFSVGGFLNALLFSLLLTIIQEILEMILKKRD